MQCITFSEERQTSCATECGTLPHGGNLGSAHWTELQGQQVDVPVTDQLDNIQI